MFSFEEKDAVKKNVSIFNNGSSGVAENVTIKALKKGVDYDGDRTPDYKLQYSDDSGSVEMAYYYLTEEGHNPQYGSFADAVQKQWRKVGSILSICGVSSTGDFKTAKDMLDSLMGKINTAVKGKTFKVFANYGHVNNPRKWLQIRSWTPFVELQETSPTTLKATKIDQMERLVPDAPASGSDDLPFGEDKVEEGWGD